MSPRPRIRIGAVAFLNARPLVHGLAQDAAAGRIEIVYDAPSGLAERMDRGELDVALLPSVELGRIPGLVVVPGLGISCRGPARSVLLVSRKPPDGIESIALDPESRTSNVLVRVLFAEREKAPDYRPGPSDLEAALRECDAAVRIGDKALFEPLPPGAAAIDLGEVWAGATGLPFVFAVWAAREGALDRDVYEMLHASRRSGAGAVERIAAEHRWNGRAHPDVAREYLTRHIRYRLGSDEVKALERFLAAARDLGLVETDAGIRLASFGPSSCREVAEARGLAASRGATDSS